MIRYSVAVIVIVSVVLVQSGCATLLRNPTKNIAITSNQPGATITIDGVPLGQTPSKVSVDTTRDQLIVVTSPAGQSFVCFMNSTVDAGWIVLDMFVSGAIVVDLITGRLRSIKSNACHAPI